MNESIHNPTIPLWVDITFTVFVLAWIFITISVLVAIVRTDFDRPGGKFWWSALVIAVPVLGALVWLLFGRPPRDSRSRT
ncbi:PLDc N-terminal domain-containing protein [Rhodococcus erythropolis]|uniref:PLDc N-terminal domain-containing protein n=1 Tax=Rhodococcus erythropolis TaxID=1833 RepID=A0A8I0ZX06_RHOER|nr:PLDc N-terminal domain-containing protein [Rhodococcus erythropolis]MBH5147141.1 PLDc N-terminal domain-containing protein [Rhodococcus erythropolis]